jgi:hypothetical protein
MGFTRLDIRRSGVLALLEPPSISCRRIASELPAKFSLLVFIIILIIFQVPLASAGRLKDSVVAAITFNVLHLLQRVTKNVATLHNPYNVVTVMEIYILMLNKFYGTGYVSISILIL